MLLLAPAKLNLTLEVLARRPDGYHGLRSVMVPIGLFDRITIEPSSQLSLSCDLASLCDDNIVLRALRAVGCAGARVVLEKRIPIAAGLGGGSSDAAAVLRAAMDGRLAHSDGPRDWLAVARTLGSDVPFFLAGTGALVEGTGDRVTAVGSLPAWWCVVAAPAVSIATAEAYEVLDAAREQAQPPVRPRSESASLSAVEALQRGDFAGVLGALVNDFSDVITAAHAPVAQARAALAAAAGHAMLSGSGGAVFALFEAEEEAKAAAERIGGRAELRSFVAPFYPDAGWQRPGGAS